MTFAEPFYRPYRETVATLRERLLNALPAGLSRVEGSWARDMVEISALEFALLYDELNTALAMTFPAWATGQYLDAHAASYGLVRDTGQHATGTVRFTGEAGSAVASGLVVSVTTTDPAADRASFVTTNATTQYVDPDTLYVDVPVESTEIGSDQNVAPGTITLPEAPIPGITNVTNRLSTEGGTDPENDEQFRRRVMTEAALPVGSGTKRDYVQWAREIPGVSDVAVEGLWDSSPSTGTNFTPGTGATGGTVRLSVRGAKNTPVDWRVVELAQKHIDPSRQLVCLLEDGEPWALTSTSPAGGSLGAWNTTDVQTGFSSLTVVNSQASQTVIVELPRAMDLSRFDDADEFHLYAKSNSWQNVSNTSYVQFEVDGSNYYRCTFADLSPTWSVVMPSSDTDAWWLWKIRRSQFAATGTPSWDLISKVKIAQITNGSGAATTQFDYFSIRSVSGAIGEGRAPVGASVTVVTPVAKEIDVAAALTLKDGYTLSGANGTSNVTDLVQAAIQAYLADLQPGDPVRFVGVANAIHDTPGIIDFTISKMARKGQSGTANVAVTMHEYATLNLAAGGLVLT